MTTVNVKISFVGLKLEDREDGLFIEYTAHDREVAVFLFFLMACMQTDKLPKYEEKFRGSYKTVTMCINSHFIKDRSSFFETVRGFSSSTFGVGIMG
jgi:hypothetical protein